MKFLIVIIPLLLLAFALYRLWQSYQKRFQFKKRLFVLVYNSLLMTAIMGLMYVTYSYCRCIWPYQCGEGFASGYAAAGVMLLLIETSVFYLLTEAVLFFMRKKD